MRHTFTFYQITQGQQEWKNTTPLPVLLTVLSLSPPHYYYTSSSSSSSRLHHLPIPMRLFTSLAILFSYTVALDQISIGPFKAHPNCSSSSINQISYSVYFNSSVKAWLVYLVPKQSWPSLDQQQALTTDSFAICLGSSEGCEYTTTTPLEEKEYCLIIANNSPERINGSFALTFELGNTNLGKSSSLEPLLTASVIITGGLMLASILLALLCWRSKNRKNSKAEKAVKRMAVIVEEK